MMRFMTCSLLKYCKGDQEEGELGEACSMHRGDESFLKMYA